MTELLEILQHDATKVRNNVDLTTLEGKSLLLTGASGLLGVNFLASLDGVMDPASIHVVIRSEPEVYLEQMLTGMTIHHGDLTDYDFIKTLPKTDLTIHAGGYGQPGRFMKDPDLTLSLNTTATYELLKCLKPNGKFLFISTSEVYSGLDTAPYCENHIGTTTPSHQRACYIEGKRGGETFCNIFRGKGINAKSARLALAYGPGTKCGDHRVLNNFIEKALKGRISLLDKGLAQRTYCYISDVIEIMWHILLDGKQPVYNVGGKSETTIAGLAKKIAGILDVSVEFPDEMAGIVDAPKNVCLDLSLVEQEFGKQKYVELEYGLEQTIRWQRLIYGAGK